MSLKIVYKNKFYNNKQILEKVFPTKSEPKTVK